MNQLRLLELSDRVRQLKSDVNSDCSELLRSEVQASSSPEEKAAIYDMLSVELQSQNRLDEAEVAIKERIALKPQIPDGWINLALHFHHHTKEAQKALSAIETALEKAKETTSFVRQAHLERIRIALALKEYQIVEDSLVELIKYFPPHGSMDVRLESEFLAKFPPGAVNERLVLDYEAKVASDLDKS